MQNAEKLSVTLTSDMVRILRESVDAGEFATTSEAVRDAIRLWQKHRVEDAERLAAMRERIRRSVDDPRPSLTAEEAEREMSRLFGTA